MALVEKQDGELASKKYGLVWDSEREPEQVVLDCENNLPVLKRVKGKEIRDPKVNGLEDNILIEGDNYHALTVLNYTHPESIDVIYIDPPYNTGNKSWKYNNSYVEQDDSYLHSKWLNMMEKRLNLAKGLLKEDGVLICAIDDNELATLSLLLEKIFPNKIRNTIVIVHNPHGVSRSGFSRTHEYAIFILNSNQIINKKDAPEDLRNINLRRSGNNSLRADSPTMFYPIYIEKKSLKIISAGDVPDKNFHPAQQMTERKEYYEVWPIDSKGIEKNWYYSKGRVIKSGKEELECRWVKNKLQISFRHSNNSEQTYKTVWSGSEYDAGAYGATLVKDITSNSFPFPKSINTVYDCLRAVLKSKNALILDFFAGSGTTGHAVLELNKEDDGNRKFILCTNNENNICEGVTYPRLQKVIKGYKKNGDGEKVDGLGGNLQYFKTDLLKQTKNKDQVRIDLTYKCTEMLCVKENIFNLEIEKEDYKIFSSNNGKQFLCVYYNLFDESFVDFVKELKKLKGKKIVYMFSMDGKVDKKLFADVKDCVVEEIPQKIVEVYRRLVKMNIPIKADTIFLEFEKAHKKIFEESEKDEGARILRIVLEKTIQKIAQKSNVSIFKDNRKEEKIAVLNDQLKDGKMFSKVQWEENRTCFAIGNHASHGDYGEYTLRQVENFYRHVQSLFNDFGI